MREGTLRPVEKLVQGQKMMEGKLLWNATSQKSTVQQLKVQCWAVLSSCIKVVTYHID